MATPYNAIHSAALAKITDRDILKFTDAEREGIFDEYLIPAVVDFRRLSKIDLSDRDNILRQFNNTLDDEIINILATGEVYYWCLPRVNNVENMRLALNTKDFNLSSPQGLLSQLQTLRDFLKKEFRQLRINYSYDTGDIVNLKVFR